MRLRSASGKAFRGRCRAPNLCRYCAKLGAVENAEMLSLDAERHGAPQVWACFTTREAKWDAERFRYGRKTVMEALRRRWPVEYVSLLEYTTGYGPRSGGRRRPHWNLLLKGVGLADMIEVQRIASRVWCNHVDAIHSKQYVAPVEEVGGLVRYLALHFMKESQAPPKGWKGQRFRPSNGYYPEGARVARDRAKRSVAFNRELYKVQLSTEGALCDDLAAELAHVKLAEREADKWELAHVLNESSDPLLAKRREARARLRPKKEVSA